MITFLHLLFWPVILILLTVGSWLINLNMWGAIWAWIVADPLDRIVLIVSIWIVWHKIVKPGIRFLYAIRHTKDLVTMKVILPRNDSKIDEEKRTEKDWKEKIAIMEQLYRALWEVKALNVWTVLHTWVWRFNTMSFEFFVDKNALTFYIVVRKNLVGIVEKQIQSS